MPFKAKQKNLIDLEKVQDIIQTSHFIFAKN